MEHDRHPRALAHRFELISATDVARAERDAPGVGDEPPWANVRECPMNRVAVDD